MALTNKQRQELTKKFNAWALAAAPKAVDKIKQDIRVDSGEMRANTRAEVRTERDKEVIQIVSDTDYAYTVELRYGLFENGDSLAAKKEEYAKEMLR